LKLSLARVDERLIHGQVMTAWVKKHWIKKIILVDDDLVKDDFMKEVLCLSAPQGVKIEVRSAADTVAAMENDSSDESTMFLFKDLKYVLMLVNYGYALPELDIGNIGSAPGRKPFTKEVYISEAEKDILRELIQKNVHVYIQKLPQDAQVDVAKKL
jgi:PTS system mannose-specific IIB component